jgi:hypothetical protein
MAGLENSDEMSPVNKCQFREIQRLEANGMKDEKTPTASSVEQVSQVIILNFQK